MKTRNHFTKLVAGALCVFSIFSAQADFVQELISKFPNASDAKVEKAFADFYSVVKGNEVVFVSEDFSILINGDVIDLAGGGKSLTTQLRDANKPKFNVSDLNTKDAIKFGSGSKRLYVFSDPDCPYCRQLEGDLGKLKDTQVYVFPFPLTSLHPNARVISESIWCSADKAASWKAYLLAGVKPKFATCDNPISRNLALGEKYQVQGTPALVFEDGSIIPGAVSAERIQAQLDAGASK